MQCETEDLINFAGCAFRPMFFVAMANRYPSAPLHIIARRDRFSSVTYTTITAAPVSITDSFDPPSQLRPPWPNVPLYPSKGFEETFPTWNKRLVPSAVQSTLRKSQISANPSNATTPFYFHAHYDASRVASLRCYAPSKLSPNLMTERRTLTRSIEHFKVYQQKLLTNCQRKCTLQ